MMRVLTIVVVLAAALWSGFWVLGARTVDQASEQLLDDARTDGWQIAFADRAVAGFPNRLDTTLTDFSVTTPDGLWSVSLPMLQVFALVYRPNQIIAVPASPIAVMGPLGPAEILADQLRASATLSLSTRPDLDRAVVEATAAEIAGPDWRAGIEQGQVALRQTDGSADHYDLALTLSQVRTAGLDPRLPDQITRLTADATAGLTAPLANGGRLQSLHLRSVVVDWDATRLTLTGKLEVAASGLPEGTVTLTATGWRALIALAQDMGLPAGQATLITAGLTGVERDGQVQIPLTLRDGTLFFGTLALAPLPRLR